MQEVPPSAMQLQALLFAHLIRLCSCFLDIHELFWRFYQWRWPTKFSVNDLRVEANLPLRKSTSWVSLKQPWCSVRVKTYNESRDSEWTNATTLGMFLARNKTWAKYNKRATKKETGTLQNVPVALQQCSESCIRRKERPQLSVCDSGQTPVLC